jgi:hypothetical protein
MSETNTEKELIDFIAHQLDIAGIRYMQQRSVRGVIPDFIIEAKNHGLIIIEAKTWDKKAGFTNRAIEQARLYKEAIDAERGCKPEPQKILPH